MRKATRPAIFQWRQTEPLLILHAVRWYRRYSLSPGDGEESLAERGLEADHTTIWRWVQCDGPELDQRPRRHLKPANKSWRVDETHGRVKGRWCYVYRAIDSTGTPIDRLLPALRNPSAALPAPAGPILEQHPGAGSLSAQTTGEREAGGANLKRGGERLRDTKRST